MRWLWIPILAGALLILVRCALPSEQMAVWEPEADFTPEASLRPAPAFLQQVPRVLQLPPPVEGYKLTYSPAREDSPELVVFAFTSLGREEQSRLPILVEYTSGTRRWYAARWSCNSVQWSAELSWASPVEVSAEEAQLDEIRTSLERLCD
jgi:hypothetical protein